MVVRRFINIHSPITGTPLTVNEKGQMICNDQVLDDDQVCWLEEGRHLLTGCGPSAGETFGDAQYQKQVFCSLAQCKIGRHRHFDAGL
jgi:hypothetical protein